MNAGGDDAGRTLVLFCLASHVVFGFVLVPTNRKLWLSAAASATRRCPA